MSFIGKVIAHGQLAEALRGRPGSARIVSLDERFQVRQTEGGTLISLKIPDWIARARIVSHTGAPGVPANPSSIVYTVQMIDAGHMASTVFSPNWRLVANDEVEVYPAPPGTLCYMVRFPNPGSPNGESWFLDVQERIAFADCTPPGAARIPRRYAEARP